VQQAAIVRWQRRRCICAVVHAKTARCRHPRRERGGGAGAILLASRVMKHRSPLPATARGARVRSLALAACLLAAAPWSLAADSKAAQYYEDALQRFEKKDYPAAIIQLKNALARDKTMLQVHVLLGKALLASGQAAAAEAAFDEALRLGVNRSELVVPLARTLVAQGKLTDVVDPQRFGLAGLPVGVQSELLLIKAAAHGDLGDAKAALKDAEDARALSPNAVDGWLAEVPLRIRARQAKEALDAVEKARKIDPNSAYVHHQYGSILHVQGDLKGALAAYDKALAAEPLLADARIARAGIYLDLKRDADAAKDVATLLESSPLDPRGWYLSATLAEREGKPQAVKTALKKITELLDPVPLNFVRYRPQIMMLNGQAHYGLGEREKAKPYFEGFARLQPGTPVSKLLANIYLAEGNHDRAAEALEQYLRTAPNDAQAMALLASAYMAKGRNARAAELMQRALRTNDAAELYTAYGMSLLGTGQAAGAVAQLETAYKKDPGQTQAAFALVGLYLRGGQTAKALGIAQGLVKRQPGNPSYQNLLGLAKAQARDLPGARAAYEQAVTLDPTLQQANLNLARLEMGSNNLERAQTLLTGVLKADEFNTEAMFELASLAQRVKKPEEALRWLQRAYDLAGIKDLRSSLALVDLHMRAGRKADALKVSQALAAAAPDSLPVIMALVRAQLLNNDLAGAKTSLSTANRIAPFEAPVHVEIALLHLAAGNVPGAAYSLDKALSAKADHLPAQVLMTDVEIRQGELQKAEQRAQQLAKREPKQAIGYSLLGDVAAARKQPAQALDFYKKAYQVEPSSDTLGRLFNAQAAQNVKAAVPLAEQWLKNRPNDLGTRRLLAETHVRSNNMPAAREEFERLRQLMPKDPGVLNDLANVLLRLKDPQALAVSEQALSADPKSVTAIDTAGWVAFNMGSLDRATQLLRDARLRDPDSPTIRYHLAAALVKAGRKVEAQNELSTALQSKLAFEGRADAEALMRSLK
jgi:cellulose synthase operon protein C